MLGQPKACHILVASFIYAVFFFLILQIPVRMLSVTDWESDVWKIVQRYHTAFTVIKDVTCRSMTETLESCVMNMATHIIAFVT